MIPTRSELLGFDEADETSHGRSNPTLVSLHFIRSSLRRRWLVCVLSAVVGLLAATAFLFASPQAHTAKTTLVLSHSPEVEPSRAMSTDVSLLKTRTVAAQTVASLGLTMAPDDFLKSVTVEPVSSELMSITLTAPTGAEAIHRLETLMTIYLGFRGEQLTLQSNVLVSGMQQRIEKLQGEIEALSRRIEQLAASNTSSDSTLSDTIAQRAYIQGQIDTLRQSVEDATLLNASVVASSRVIDPPATDAGGFKRRIVLTLASGLIGGAALGCGVVLFVAIISDRLRRRSDVAAALDVAVPVSVGRIAPIPRRWLSLPYVRTLDSRRTDERYRLAHAIEMELPSPRQSGRLGVVCIDNAEEISFAVATAATNLAAEGRSVAVIDLTKQGNLALEVVSSMATHRPTLLRPRGIPMLAGGTADLRAIVDEDGTAPSLDRTDITLVLADLDPSVGADHLLTWTDRVLIGVTAGRSSAELVRTAADMVRSAGLELRLAALLHTERTDDSSGTAGFDRPISVPIHLGDAQEPLKTVGKSVEEKQAVNEEQAAAVSELTAEEQSAGEQAGDEEQAATLEEHGADEPPVEEQAAEEPTVETRAVADLEQAAAEEPVTPDQEQVVVEDQEQSAEEQTAEEQSVEEEQAATLGEHGADEPPVEEPAANEQQTEDELSSEEQTSDEEQAVNEEQAADEPSVEMQAVADLEQAAVEEPASADQEQVAVEDQTPDQEKSAEEQTAEEQSVEEEQAATLEEHGADEPPIEEQAAEEQPVQEQAADEQQTEDELSSEVQTSDEEQAVNQEQAAVEEQSADDEQAADEPTVEMRAVADLEQAAAEEPVTPDQDQVVLADQEQSAEEQTAEEQSVEEDKATAFEEQLTDKQPIEEQAADEQPVQEQAADEHELSSEEQTSDEEQAVNQEQAAVEEQSADDEHADEPTVEMRAVADLEQAAVEQPALADQEQVLLADRTPDQEQSAEEQTAEEQSVEKEQTAAPEELLTDEEPAAEEEQSADEEPTEEEQPLYEQIAEDDAAVETELVADPDLVANLPEQTNGSRAWQLFFLEHPLVQVGPSPDDDEWAWSWNWLYEPDLQQDSAVIGADDEAELLAEPDEVPYPSLEGTGVNGWDLYVDVYPTAYAASGPDSDDDQLNWGWDWDWSPDGSASKPDVIAADDEADEAGDEHSLTTSANGREHGAAPPEARAEESTHDGGHLPVGNGQVSNGQGRPRTRTRTRNRRRKRSRLK